MSKWTKEQIDEFWRQPHGHGALLAAASSFQWQCAEGAESPITSEELGRALRDADRRQRECNASHAAEAETRARKAEKLSRFVEAEMQTSSSTPLDGYALELSKIEAEIQEATKRQHASLGTMFRADPSVPPGYVLPRDAWEQFVAEAGQMVRGIKGARPERAMQLADECGSLRTENTALLVENARLRRRIEDMERKGKR